MNNWVSSPLEGLVLRPAISANKLNSISYSVLYFTGNPQCGHNRFTDTLKSFSSYLGQLRTETMYLQCHTVLPVYHDLAVLHGMFMYKLTLRSVYLQSSSSLIVYNVLYSTRLV